MRPGKIENFLPFGGARFWSLFGRAAPKGTKWYCTSGRGASELDRRNAPASTGPLPIGPVPVAANCSAKARIPPSDLGTPVTLTMGLTVAAGAEVYMCELFDNPIFERPDSVTAVRP